MYYAMQAQLRAENEQYLKQHPELKNMVAYFMSRGECNLCTMQLDMISALVRSWADC
jgi:hypothetical protein